MGGGDPGRGRKRPVDHAGQRQLRTKAAGEGLLHIPRLGHGDALRQDRPHRRLEGGEEFHLVITIPLFGHRGEGGILPGQVIQRLQIFVQAQKEADARFQGGHSGVVQRLGGHGGDAQPRRFDLAARFDAADHGPIAMVQRFGQDVRRQRLVTLGGGEQPQELQGAVKLKGRARE